jgi:hypothetical protein
MKNDAQQQMVWMQVIPSVRYRRGERCEGSGFPTT